MDKGLRFFHALPINLAPNLTFHFVSTLRSRTSLSKLRSNVFRSDNGIVKTVFNECGSVFEGKLKDKVLLTDGFCRHIFLSGFLFLNL